MRIRNAVKTVLPVLVPAIGVPVMLVLGSTVFQNRQYAFISFGVAVLACVPMLMRFEQKPQTVYRLILLAVLTALSVAGRFLFAMVPFFKPVTAMTVITAMYFGPEAGFMTGALTAVISNFYFGQGAWTPFQMSAWGLIGLAAGCLAPVLKKSRVCLMIFGVLAGIFYSLILDVFSALWQDNTLLFSRYIAMLTSSLPMTAVYAVSNVVFLLLLTKPVGEKLTRVQKKYGL